MEILIDHYLPRATGDEINAERDRRIAAGFMFRGRLIQSAAGDRENIAGAKSAASDAKALGALSGDYGWQRLLDPVEGAEIFAWICADNSRLNLDVDDTIALGYAAMLHKQALIFTGNDLKRRNASGEEIGDVGSAALWP